MRILLSNDDGINAPGLKILEKIAYMLSDDVWIVAPELDQSGASHSLTLRDPLRIREVSEKKFAVNGTPTDCVMVAATHILKDNLPTVLLSGVNYGANLAEDITYSGTVAAAMEGALLGIPSIAINQVVNHGHPAKWATAEHFIPPLLRKLLDIKFHEHVFININVPDLITQSVKGIKVSHQGQRRIDDNLIERVDPRGRKYYWIGIIEYTGTSEKGTDLAAIEDGYISVTPLSLDFTHHKTLTQLQDVFA
jgi:5'-nucleotidase